MQGTGTTQQGKWTFTQQRRDSFNEALATVRAMTPAQRETARGEGFFAHRDTWAILVMVSDADLADPSYRA